VVLGREEEEEDRWIYRVRNEVLFCKYRAFFKEIV
jgi:hypothetical protein